ncbi:Integrase catalytic region [Alicyclobacillus hesperidum URH17-3-68]|nr:Integrase catalytic region [Alicyclobacillus hesperidum URH17-3-68]
MRKYKATTNSKHNHPVHENVLNQTFRAQRPNQVWMSDITYVWTEEGWLYVASVMDLYTRKIVGWKAGARMTKDLVMDALEQAYQREKPAAGVLPDAVEKHRIATVRVSYVESSEILCLGCPLS